MKNNDITGMDLLKQQFNLMNPYGVELLNLQKKMEENRADPSIGEQESAMKNVEMMNDFQSLKRKYTATINVNTNNANYRNQWRCSISTTTSSYINIT